jgi:hypothetical protein
MTEAEIISELTSDFRHNTAVDSIDITSGVTDAQRETGFSLPTSDSFEIIWLKRRASRWVYHYIRTGQAHKFKFEEINLQNRFDHYDALIKSEDREFVKAIEENMDKFAGVDPYKLFGTKVDAGFAYDDLGHDITYDEDNIVVSSPNEET